MRALTASTPSPLVPLHRQLDGTSWPESAFAVARPATSFGASVAGSEGVVRTIELPRRRQIEAGRLTPSQLDQLMQLASAHPENQWPIGGNIADGRNKHRTNTFREIRDGLEGPFNWFESDVRVQDGRPVAAHDSGDRDGLTMAEWVQIGAASGRGLKFDFKEARAIAPVVQLVRQAGVPDERLMWNVTIFSPDRTANASMDTLAELRRQFPRAIINLSIGTTPYDDRTIRNAVTVAREIGGPIMFPLNAQFVTPSVVTKFRMGGKVAIWNTPITYNPTNIPADVAKFRSWGVDGMIDLLSNHFSAGQGDSVNERVPVHRSHRR